MVATRAQISAVAAARPAARLDGLPVDLLAHIATHVALRVDLLALRCVSRPCQDAVRRAAKEHPVLDEASFRLSDGSTARAIAAWGQMFGSCRQKPDAHSAALTQRRREDVHSLNLGTRVQLYLNLHVLIEL